MFVLFILSIITVNLVGGVNSATITCTEYTTSVSDGGPFATYYNMGGTLCVPSGFSSNGTILVLVPGATYTQLYWDFSLPTSDYYNFRMAMNNAGYATYTIDRLGTGSSDKPAIGVSISLQANAVHTVISDLKSGSFNLDFGKIVLGGHSLGSVISIFYYFNHNAVDVDGVIITGAAHWLSVLDLPAIAPTFLLPCQLDPIVSTSSECSYGYGTTMPGTRGGLFYYPATTDPQVLAKDEATKSVFSFTEAPGSIVGVIGPVSVTIDVPVLYVIGSKDRLLCNSLVLDCTDAKAVENYEKPYYAGSPDFQVFVLPNAGHDVNLANNTHLYQERVVTWLTSVIDL